MVGERGEALPMNELYDVGLPLSRGRAGPQQSLMKGGKVVVRIVVVRVSCGDVGVNRRRDNVGADAVYDDELGDCPSDARNGVDVDGARKGDDFVHGWLVVVV